MTKLFRPLLVAVGLGLLASPALAVSAHTVVEAKFLTGPGKDYDSAGIVPVNTKLQVIWCGTKANYCLVDIKHRLGWVPFASLQFSSKKDVAFIVEMGNGNGPSSPNGGPSGPGPNQTKTLNDSMALPHDTQNMSTDPHPQIGPINNLTITSPQQSAILLGH